MFYINNFIIFCYSFSEGEEFITSNQLFSKLKEVEKIQLRSEKLPQIEANASQIEGTRAGAIKYCRFSKIRKNSLICFRLERKGRSSVQS